MLVDVEVAGEVVNEGTQSVNHHLHVGDLHLDSLTLDDRLAEGHAVSSTLEGDLEHTLSHTEVGACDVNAGNAQGVDSHFHALALFAEQVLGSELEVGELQTSMACTLAAHHVGHGDDLETRRIVGNEEGGKTGVLVAFLVGDSDDVGVVRAVGVRNEPLLAVENIGAVSLLDSGGVKVSTGAAGLLGDGEVAVDGLVLELVHELGLKLRLAVVLEDTPVHVSRMMEMHAHSARATGELFLNLEDLELVEVPSAVLSGEIETIEIVFLGEFVELLRERVGNLDLLLELLERAFCQLADLLEVRLELFIRNSCFRIHRSPFTFFQD